MSGVKSITEAEAVEYAVEALQELDAQYSQVEVLDQIIHHILRSGQTQRLQGILDAAREQQFVFDAVLLTFGHLIRTAQPAPEPMAEWLASYLAGEISRPKRHHRHTRGLPEERDERDRMFCIILRDLEELGVPRSPTVRTGSFFGYEIIAQANRRLSKKPTTYNSIRKICERRERALKHGRTPFSQIDVLRKIIGA